VTLGGAALQHYGNSSIVIGLLQFAEILTFGIRASLQRCRKFFEIRCPFRGWTSNPGIAKTPANFLALYELQKNVILSGVAASQSKDPYPLPIRHSQRSVKALSP